MLKTRNYFFFSRRDLSLLRIAVLHHAVTQCVGYVSGLTVKYSFTSKHVQQNLHWIFVSSRVLATAV
jgi:hypothetical protein